MSRFERIAENQIVVAMEAGKFRNLRGGGEPFDARILETDDSGWWAAHHILKQASLRPLWVELDLEIRRRRAQAIRSLERSVGPGASRASIRRAEDEFRREIEHVNKLIGQLNSVVPAEPFKHPSVNAHRIPAKRGH